MKFLFGKFGEGFPEVFRCENFFELMVNQTFFDFNCNPRHPVTPPEVRYLDPQNIPIKHCENLNFGIYLEV